MKRRPKTVVVTVIAVVAFLAILIHSLWPTSIVAEVERAGGRVYQFGDTGVVQTAREGLGLSPRASSSVIRLSDTAITDDWVIAQRRGLSGLANVDLDLNRTSITDESVRVLSELTEIWSLSLSETRVTDRSMEHLAGSGLIFLDISQTDVTDAGLDCAAYMPLQMITIDGSQATQDGLAHLKRSSTLYAIEIHGADDAAVQGIAGWTRLRVVSLYGRGVSDKAVAALCTLTRLEDLVLTDTGISKDGLDALQKALPSCSINYEP